MEILGIGPGEFVLIMIVLLVVVGPERLPSLARQAGRALVRARNWVQSSPDAAMVLRARQELEAELANLRSSLLEVQSVRDEVLGAAKQIEESVESFASATKAELNEFGSIGTPPPTTGPASALPAPDGNVPLAPGLPTTNGALPAADPPADPASPPDPAALASIEVRLQAIMSDLFALQAQLQQRGLLDADWQPPSWGVQLPAEPPAEPISDTVEQ